MTRASPPGPADIRIGLADGRRFAARLWRPGTDAPTPAILEYLPYRKRDGTAPRDATTHPVFAAAGYACVRVDIAGTGDSAQVSLNLAQCRLILPERRAVDEIDAAAPGPPAEYPVHAAETLRAPANRTERRIDSDGTHVLETFDDFGASRDLEHGLETGSHVEQRYSIHPGDPLSARHEARWHYEFRRGDWSVRIDSESVMTSDAGSFHLARRVTASEGERIVIARAWEEDLSRGLS